MKKKLSPIAVISIIFGAVVMTTVMLAVNGLFGNLFEKKLEDKEFSKAGMTITLTDNFVEKEIVSQTASYQTDKFAVMALKEEFTLFQTAGIPEDITLSEYADLIMSSNSITSEVEKKDSLVCFAYEKDINGKQFTYLASVYRGTDAYWLIQFSCESKNYEDSADQFITWAKSVKVS